MNRNTIKEMECFYELLRQYRRNRGMSQEDLAEKANLHRTYISELENGKKNPSLKTLLQLAKALHLEVWQLLYFRDFPGISGASGFDKLPLN